MLRNAFLRPPLAWFHDWLIYQLILIFRARSRYSEWSGWFQVILSATWKRILALYRSCLVVTWSISPNALLVLMQGPVLGKLWVCRCQPNTLKPTCHRSLANQSRHRMLKEKFWPRTRSRYTVGSARAAPNTRFLVGQLFGGMRQLFALMVEVAAFLLVFDAPNLDLWQKSGPKFVMMSEGWRSSSQNALEQRFAMLQLLLFQGGHFTLQGNPAVLAFYLIMNYVIWFLTLGHNNCSPWDFFFW